MSSPRQTTMQRKTGSARPEYTSGSVLDGKYRLIRELGEGGMGSVWAAHSRPLDVAVALKLLRIDTAHDDSAERLIREARAMARLADPGIVRVFDVGQTEHGEPYIVMELLVGATLRQLLEGGRLDGVRAVRLLLPIARALECAHRAGVVHRDVKPDNIVLAQGARGDVQPKLLDFGAAKLVQGVDHLTRVGMVVGSPLYMSPEQARGERVDHRTDLWSACAVLYEAVTGRPPFHADNTHALLHAISTQEVRALPAGHCFDDGLWAIVQRGLTKSRDERWQTARELMLELAGWLRAQGTTEDITGTALQGRGLGRYSSSPDLAAGSATGDLGKSRARATAVVGAHLVPELALVQELSSRPARAQRPPLVSRLLAGRHGSPRFWSGVAAATLVAVLLGIWWHRATEPALHRATPAKDPLVRHAIKQPAPTRATATPVKETAAPSAAEPTGAEPPRAPTAATPPTPARASRSVTPHKEKRASNPTKTSPGSGAPKASFKDPFD